MPRRDTPEPGSYDILHPSEAHYTSGVTPMVRGFGYASRLRIRFATYNVISPSLPLNFAYFVEDTHDGGTLWNPLGSVVVSQNNRIFPVISTIDVASPFTDALRVRWELRGGATAIHFDAICYSE